MDVIQQTCRQHDAALLCVSHDPSMAERFEHRMAMADLIQRPVSV
jgi:ABC-type lipoprotein export system ATPase subunit